MRSSSTYAFILDEAGFEGTMARLRAKQKAGVVAGMRGNGSGDHR
ncbi:hypothetical protein [Mycobacterium vicinigordonae]